MSKNFALIGAAGYIAPRHMKAIKETGNQLVVAMDKFDSVGILDSYFPQADFFVEFERFDRHVDKLRRENNGHAIDYVSICSPNYLHDAHIRFALRSGADAICEKPLVLNPWNIDALADFSQETGRKIHAILQLRLHPAIIALKQKIDQDVSGKIYDIDLSYITSRGSWYHFSWKGDEAKSGGVATNIGVHFFDMLSWIFGAVKKNITHLRTGSSAAGYIEFARARVRWFLSVDAETLPESIAKAGQRTYRSITLDGEEIEFSEGFTDLHTASYRQILAGEGFDVTASRQAIQIVHDIRTTTPVGCTGEYHPFCKKERLA